MLGKTLSELESSSNLFINYMYSFGFLLFYIVYRILNNMILTKTMYFYS
uniref:Uncharacterized protein n=1 Tax=Polysiphonia sertularioides TaxID=945028 RepID=A0A1Z1M8T6_9FLOR|nr:hypothetical protein [Polysiphonia sertularioides]ARW62396.1 hypothetical protein [Polysiphonia sertularioides]